MNITTRTSLMGFLLTLAALQVSAATAATDSSIQHTARPTVEARLTRLTAAIRSRETQLPETHSVAMQSPTDLKIAIGWADGSRGGQWTDGAFGRGAASGPNGGQWANGAYGRGAASGPNGGGWGNTRYGGAASGANGSWSNVHAPWVNGGGSFVNANPWYNTWADGGGFYNHY